VGCGDVITEDTELTADIGPCPGNGLIVEADGITLDLGGHTVTGDPNARRAPDKAGVLLYRVSGVTVTNGTVTSFDGGVVVRGGADNTVRKVTARDNVSYRVLTGRDSRIEDIDRETSPFCDFGDGVALFNTSGNLVEHNEVTGNGPYAGISLVGNSDDNMVAKNRILDNDVLNINPAGQDIICGGPPGVMSDGRMSMTIGVKIEGPGADRNVIEGNQVRNASMAGIAVVGQLTDGPQSTGNVVRNNHISDTARSTQGDPQKEGRAHSHGIALMRCPPRHRAPWAPSSRAKIPRGTSATASTWTAVDPFPAPSSGATW
jgi:parallel beta-helix repeat protein